MASLKEDPSKRTTDEWIKRPETQSPDQNILLPEKEASSSHLPHGLAPGQAMVHMSTFKGDAAHSSICKDALQEACRHGQVADVRHLIDQGTDVNSKDVFGRTCILLCSISFIEPIEKINVLSSNGGNIQDIDHENNGILHLACDLGMLETVQYLVDIGLDINSKGFRNRSCIMACSQSKTQATDKIELLRKMGANIHDTDVQNDGMLHLACLSGTLDTVKYLIDLGLDINTKGFKDRTCILLCSHSQIQAIEKIELIKSKGGNIYDTDGGGNGMLHLACVFGTLETVRYLVALKLNINAEGPKSQPCILDCSESEIQAVEKIEFLRLKGGNINNTDDQNNGILHIACALGTLDTVKYLIDLGLDINTKGYKGRTCILQCSVSNIQGTEKIELIKSKGGNIYDTDDNKNGLLHLAYAFGTLDTVRYLVDLGLDIDTKGCKGRTWILQCSLSKTQAIEKIEFSRSKGGNIHDTDNQNDGLLHLASAFGTLDTVKYLVDLGLYITTRGFIGRTCILQCGLSKTQAVEKIEFLRLKCGGNIYDRDDQNDGILHLACYFSTLDTVKYLVDLGLDINTKGYKGRTCILQCSLSKIQAKEKIEFLMSKGGNICDRDDNNSGMLHIACENGTLETVQYLVNLGYDINIKDDSGNTPVSLAVWSDTQSLQKVDYLISKGAKLSWFTWSMHSIRTALPS
ncbi:serine/threonine-protein phosphatase 6 regulatory ankyrin repeat subunit A isoform X1 [Patella vulgata]|uniref:serine/threonine-protein phosphatase 6 regulatory ankyrin repeat subunit A isoform X1 n=1 Tax=Patella vulgata TaxID=6465 RepID=UPI0024A86FEB|nr:serine/threonine-protein phosphatase 6 regulatory ankyrin repeat subunit A isoform X1 [Patella vulgata]XP_055954548.1 serine/threonine-protein phosphatase 6 regulatory ankyrin repeat subunit A isoform X1 [Patella vulgata]XP_055954549.1 serine/threonine-protein phosphatase 6 regulatory ankyrin repeat subunit A isoform X1 [Patella vulgata]